jgi:hypothetical protein
VQSTEIGVLKESHKIGLGSFLKCSKCAGLESKVWLEGFSDLPNQTLERELSDEQIGRFLVLADLSKSNRARLEAVRLLQKSCLLWLWVAFQMLAGGLASDGRASGLFCACQLDCLCLCPLSRFQTALP